MAKLFALVGLAFSDGNAAEKEQADGGDHQKHIFRLTPAVEHQTEQQQYTVFQLPGH